jgi:hypothetical protein
MRRDKDARSLSNVTLLAPPPTREPNLDKLFGELHVC